MTIIKARTTSFMQTFRVCSLVSDQKKKRSELANGESEQVLINLSKNFCLLLIQLLAEGVKQNSCERGKNDECHFFFGFSFSSLFVLVSGRRLYGKQ